MTELDKHQQAALDQLLNAKKLRSLSPDTVKRVFLTCLPKYKTLKEADKAARQELHRITGAFVTPEEIARAGKLACDIRDDEALTAILSLHASTRERLPLSSMDALFAEVNHTIGPFRTVLDLACGFDPIYLAARGFDVTGCDLHGGACELINRIGTEHSIPCRAVTADLLTEGAIPKGHYDLCLMMKLLPILETQRAGSAADLLDAAPADTLLVSFPTRTLGGRGVGMEAHYSEWFESIVAEDRIIRRFTHTNELIYLVRGRRDPDA